MNSTQTKDEIKHYQRNHGNRGPICSKVFVDVADRTFKYVTDPTKVNCKDCIKKLPGIGIILGSKVRKMTPTHMGRMTKEERDAKLKDILPSRSLRSMLRQVKFEHEPDEQLVEELVLTFKHYLMDVAHKYRMANELDEQALIEQLVDGLDVGEVKVS